MKISYEDRKFDLKRECPCLYTLSLNDKSCSITLLTWDSGESGWIVESSWDRYLYSDPIETYKRAKEVALHLLIEHS